MWGGIGVGASPVPSNDVIVVKPCNRSCARGKHAIWLHEPMLSKQLGCGCQLPPQLTVGGGGGGLGEGVAVGAMGRASGCFCLAKAGRAVGPRVQKWLHVEDYADDYTRRMPCGRVLVVFPVTVYVKCQVDVRRMAVRK